MGGDERPQRWDERWVARLRSGPGERLTGREPWWQFIHLPLLVIAVITYRGSPLYIGLLALWALLLAFSAGRWYRRHRAARRERLEASPFGR
jgi:hypothetical protein